MVARRRKRSKKWISWLLFLILIVGAGAICYLVWDNYFNDKKNDGDEPRPVVIDDEKKEVKVEDKEEDKQEVIEKEETKQYEGDNPNLAEELSGVVTYAGVNGDKLMIRVNINQYLSGGSCSLRLSLDGDVVMYSETVNIVNSASTSTCEGFDVPISGLTSGRYLIFVNLSADGKTGTINGEVNV